MPDEQKKVRPSQRKATDAYLKKFEELTARVPKGQRDIIRAHAESHGESLNGFINRAIAETMERDNSKAE